MKDLKFVGLKSHDCHVLMQQLLPVAIRGIAEYDLQHILTNFVSSSMPFVVKSLTRKDWRNWKMKDT